MTEPDVPTRIAVQCRRCGGWLVSTASVARRLGPVCAKHDRAEVRHAPQELPLFDLEEMGVCL